MTDPLCLKLKEVRDNFRCGTNGGKFIDTMKKKSVVKNEKIVVTSVYSFSLNFFINLWFALRINYSPLGSKLMRFDFMLIRIKMAESMPIYVKEQAVLASHQPKINPTTLISLVITSWMLHLKNQPMSTRVQKLRFESI